MGNENFPILRLLWGKHTHTHAQKQHMRIYSVHTHLQHMYRHRFTKKSCKSASVFSMVDRGSSEKTSVTLAQPVQRYDQCQRTEKFHDGWRMDPHSEASLPNCHWRDLISECFCVCIFERISINPSMLINLWAPRPGKDHQPTHTSPTGSFLNIWLSSSSS